MKKNLILGAIRDLQFRDIKPFFDSLEQTGFDGDVCFWASDLSPEIQNELTSRGVRLFPFNEIRVKIPFRNRRINLFRRAFPLMHALLRFRLTFQTEEESKEYLRDFAKKYFSVHSQRFFHFEEFLSDNLEAYEKVLITDVRDVVFQSNPFDDVLGNTVYCFLEDSRFTLRSEKWNSTWLKEIGGQKLLDELGDYPISCSGVTIGGATAVLNYLRVLNSNLLSNLHHKGLEQGTHNVIIRKGLIDCNVVENNRGPVLTMGLMRPSDIHFDDGGSIVNESGKKIAILHQFDRHPEIERKIHSMISTSNRVQAVN